MRIWWRWLRTREREERGTRPGITYMSSGRNRRPRPTSSLESKLEGPAGVLEADLPKPCTSYVLLLIFCLKAVSVHIVGFLNAISWRSSGPVSHFMLQKCLLPVSFRDTFSTITQIANVKIIKYVLICDECKYSIGLIVIVILDTTKITKQMITR